MQDASSLPLLHLMELTSPLQRYFLQPTLHQQQSLLRSPATSAYPLPKDENPLLRGTPANPLSCCVIFS